MTNPDVTLLPCPDCGGQGINTDTLGTKTTVCRKCKGSGRTPAAAPAEREPNADLVDRVANSIADSVSIYPAHVKDPIRNNSYILARAAIAAMPDCAPLAAEVEYWKTSLPWQNLNAQNHTLRTQLAERDETIAGVREALEDAEEGLCSCFFRSDSAERWQCNQCGNEAFARESIEHKKYCKTGHVRAALTPQAPHG